MDKENQLPGFSKNKLWEENEKTATEILFKMPEKTFEEFLERQQSILPETRHERELLEDQELKNWAEAVGLR